MPTPPPFTAYIPHAHRHLPAGRDPISWAEHIHGRDEFLPTATADWAGLLFYQEDDATLYRCNQTGTAWEPVADAVGAAAAVQAVLESTTDALADRLARLEANATATIFVSLAGDDSENDGLHPSRPFRTIKKALEVAPEGAVVKPEPGLYAEVLPLVPTNTRVTVAGDFQRNVTITADAGSDDDVFHLKSGCSIAWVTIVPPAGRWAAQVAPGAVFTRSAWLSNCTVNGLLGGHGVRIEGARFGAGSSRPSRAILEDNLTTLGTTNGTTGTIASEADASGGFCFMERVNTFDYSCYIAYHALGGAYVGGLAATSYWGTYGVVAAGTSVEFGPTQVRLTGSALIDIGSGNDAPPPKGAGGSPVPANFKVDDGTAQILETVAGYEFHAARHLPGGDDELPWATGINMRGLIADRPAAATANGLFYLATEAGGGRTLYRSNGTLWESCGAATIHEHDAAAITSGVIAPARLGTGTPSVNTFLRGDGTWGEAGGSEQFWGNGSDGNLTVTNGQSIAARRIWQFESLTIPDNCTLFAHGQWIKTKLLTMGNLTHILSKGNDATGRLGGLARNVQGIFGGNNAGGAGSAGGTAGSNGSGGTGSDGAGAGGISGQGQSGGSSPTTSVIVATSSFPADVDMIWRYTGTLYLNSSFGLSQLFSHSGSGGGGGGAQAGSEGGGGGGGARPLRVDAKTIEVSGTSQIIESLGGNGGNASGTNAGGGGGGAPSWCAVFSTTSRPATLQVRRVLGLRGTGVGTGQPGGVGSLAGIATTVNGYTVAYGLATAVNITDRVTGWTKA